MKRSSGVLMHVSSLWGDYSEGSFGAPARAFVDLLADCGFSYWQVLPFCLPDEFHSPYKSYSAFSINPYFIDLEELLRNRWITPEEAAEAKQRSPHLCEFDRLLCERLPLLRRAAKRAQASMDPAATEAFFDAHPHVAAFCRFMAIKEANGGAEWIAWEHECPDAEALSFWRWTQYVAYTQWMQVKSYANARGVSIIGDVPIYVAHDSADVWAAPQLFRLNRKNLPLSVAGVPPDYFSADGQLWGNPLYDWKEMQRDGFAWWKARMSLMCELFDGVRIDHFRGLESYFSIPASQTTAKNGKWLKGPGMRLLRALREVTANRLIIAEDLGDITPAVKQLVADSGYPGMRVLQFGFLGEENSEHLPHNYPANCVAYTGTHDNNTLLGYVWELSGADRRRFLEYFGYEDSNWDNCYDTVMRGMMASHAGLLIFPVQDLLKYGRDTRLNTPGSSSENWAFRVTEEQLRSIDRAHWRSLNRRYGRG